ncbi:MAG TPA: crotonase/enoyl-CoA hydratase family protein [Pseudolabrys sp.]|nr:crotonase/enoyl-CoA hydratase family protein [Pseudolabrys sp.]
MAVSALPKAYAVNQTVTYPALLGPAAVNGRAKEASPFELWTAKAPPLSPARLEAARIEQLRIDQQAQAEQQAQEDARRLFALEQLEVSWDAEIGALWAFMRPRGRPSYNSALLDDIHALQRGVAAKFAETPDQLRYLVAGSRTPGVFSLGGDLDHFAASIRKGDRQALIDYGRSCVRVLHGFYSALDLPIITIGVAQGDALGGGLESLLSFNVIIAERGAKFGFPEALFGLFPGMGAYSLVARRVGAALAEEMMLSGRSYSAEEMKELGLVHILAEPGQGIAAARDYMERNKRRHAGIRGVYEAGRTVNPLGMDELDRIVEIWTDACLRLTDRDLKVMQRLVSAQNRLPPTLQAAE